MDIIKSKRTGETLEALDQLEKIYDSIKDNPPIDKPFYAIVRRESGLWLLKSIVGDNEMSPNQMRYKEEFESLDGYMKVNINDMCK